jgi:hypothetical protein
MLLDLDSSSSFHYSDQISRCMSSSSMGIPDKAARRERQRELYGYFRRGRACSWPLWQSSESFCLDSAVRRCTRRTQGVEANRVPFRRFRPRLENRPPKQEGTNAIIPPLYFVSFSCINILERQSRSLPLKAVRGSYQLTPIV